MKLSIIVPVYNEEKTIKKLIYELVSLKIQDVEIEIIIVDDGSTDNTVNEIKKGIIGNKKIKTMVFKKNSGKGSAVRAGLAKAEGDYIIIQDADLEYNPKDIASLLIPVKNGKTKVVYGTRLKRAPNFRRDERTVIFLIHYIGNKLLSLLTSVLYGQWITDMETGYKLMSVEVMKSLNLVSSGFELEPEITAKLLKKNYHIVELSISTNPRGYSEGKKLNTIKDGARALWTLIKYRFINNI